MVLKVAFNLLLFALYIIMMLHVLHRETMQTVHVLHWDLIFFLECSFVMQFTSDTMHSQTSGEFKSLTTALLMEDGCLGHPGASTSTASPQIEYRPHDWQIAATHPWAPTPNSRHLSHWLSQWKIEDRIFYMKKKRKKKKNIYIYISINRHTSTLQ